MDTSRSLLSPRETVRNIGINESDLNCNTIDSQDLGNLGDIKTPMSSGIKGSSKRMQNMRGSVILSRQKVSGFGSPDDEGTYHMAVRENQQENTNENEQIKRSCHGLMEVNDVSDQRRFEKYKKLQLNTMSDGDIINELE